MSGWLSIGEAAGLVVLGVLSVVTQRQAKKTHQAVEPNGETLGQILHEIRDLGQSNRELLRESIAQGEYAHTRNHDILNSLQRIEARQVTPPA